jgi:hypothetical protein
LIEGEPEWEIDAILTSGHYEHKKELQYLIRWLRYPKSENLWELAKDVQALKLMQTFHKEHPAAIRSIKSGSFPAVKQKWPAKFRQAIESLMPPSFCQRC